MSNDTQVEAHMALWKVARDAFDDYWHEDSKGIDSEAWAQAAQAVVSAITNQPACDEYFKARPQLDSAVNRGIFQAGSCAAVEASARQLAEQPGLFEWLKTREADSYSCSLLVRDALARLTASPTAPSTEASEPVGEREAFEAHWYDFYHAGSIQADADGTYWPKEVQCAWQAWQAARTTPPPAPVLSDAEIDAITVAQWGDRVVTAAYRAYARAIEQAIGRASRGAK